MMEGLSTAAANLVVFVHPSNCKNVPQAILRELSSLLFKYSETLGGVVLAYDFNTRAKLARILSGVHPYFGVRLKANLLLFSPKPDMHLEGKVVKVARESVHAIVLGFSSAIITDEEIRDEFKYKHKHGERLYVSRFNKQHVIKVGTVIRFVVKSLDEEILHICGSMIPVNTGSVCWLDRDSNNATADSYKKRAQPDGDIDVQEHDTAGWDTHSSNHNREGMKSKKHKYEQDY